MVDTTAVAAATAAPTVMVRQVSGVSGGGARRRRVVVQHRSVSFAGRPAVSVHRPELSVPGVTR
ncbi:hypothetical protein ABZV75_18430 [Streptomyces flaveolus]|uniref:hypothetical protein n=1 Tax=Streptomyces flaveolus TaxID=67297 RepID=UPI0033A73F23